jgi:hypothetical protein
MTAHRTVRPIPARDLEAIYRPRQFPALVDFAKPEAYLPIGTRHRRELPDIRELIGRSVRPEAAGGAECPPKARRLTLAFALWFASWVVAVAMVYGLIVGAMVMLP